MSKGAVAVANAIQSSDTKKTIVYGVVVVVGLTIVYFGIIKPITNKLGLTRNKEERQGDRAEERLSRKQVMAPTLYKKQPDLKSITSGRASELANNVYEGKGYVWDNEDMGVGGITGAGSKVNISYVADMFQRVYGRDMHTYLESYLESEDWGTIDDYISKVKKF
tara:strand:- start:92 stop:586 length:495 start_codon:yes stop_codon:yes gene_type:complete